MGDILLSREALDELLEKAAKRGAAQALSELGLHTDDPASFRQDMQDIRAVLDGYRNAKRGILNGFYKALGTAFAGGLFAWLMLTFAEGASK